MELLNLKKKKKKKKIHPEIFPYIQEIEISNIFLKKKFSYVSGNRNPENICYISGNRTFLYFKKRKT